MRPASRPSGSCGAAGSTPKASWRTTGTRTPPGPGGPCSEIFVDRGARYGPEGGPDVDEDRFMEIWNLVFIQDQVDANLEIVGELPAKNIDTGSSLERVATLLQGEDNVLRDRRCSVPLLEVVESLSGKRPRRGRARRRLAQGDRRARPRHHVPDRRRRPAVERRAAATSCAGCSAGSSRTRVGSGSRAPVMEPLVHRTVELMGRRVPRAPRERGVRPAGGDVGGGAVRRHAPPGTAAVREGRGAERGAQGPVRRRRVQAVRHVRVPAAADGGAGGRGRARGRRRPVHGAPGGAANARSAGREEGADRRRCRRRPADRVRRLPASGEPTRRSWRCSTGRAASSRSPRRARTSASS